MIPENEKPRPHGDPLDDASEGNQAQRQSDATPDAVGDVVGREESDREGGRGSSANGVPAFDEDAGEERRKLYEKSATLVSRID
ncbi:MAG: hypothetical protein LC804_05545 [Acidobacteria bacterium]|nr:hypothetical protein [Acidobacteriota bacterium]